MKYAAITMIAIVLAYLGILVFATSLNRGKGFLKNAQYSAIVMSISIPLMSLMAVVIFLLGKLVVTTLPMEIDNFYLFSISLVGVFVIFLGDFLIKTLVLNVSSYVLDKRYSHENLTEGEIGAIIFKTRKRAELIAIILFYLVSFLVYLGLFTLLSLNVAIRNLGLLSLINLIVYFFFFKFKSSMELAKGYSGK